MFYTSYKLKKKTVVGKTLNMFWPGWTLVKEILKSVECFPQELNIFLHFNVYD